MKNTKKVPSINLSLGYDTRKQWKKWSEKKLIKELTDLLTQEEKKSGRATGSIRVVYARDPGGDYYTNFTFYTKEDCLYKLKPAIEKELLNWFYE